jgi:condensin-2 complex subunit D3
VIKAWLKDFSRSALNHIFNMLNDLLLTGSSNSSLVTYIYDVCASVKKMVDSDNQWIEKIYTTSRDFILKNREDFLYNHCDERFYNYLLIFSDSNADLPQQPDERVLNFLVEYLVKASEQDSEGNLTFFIPSKWI